MKKITAILLLLLLSIQCFPQQKRAMKEPVISIAFELFGRRGKIHVKITPEFAISTGSTEKKFIVMTAEKWNELLAAANELKLSTISKLKSPTKRRETDGALHCRILISTKKNKYETQYFDSGIPMTELKSLYDKIEAIRNAINYDGDDWKDE
jgi:hypothetical protein